MNLFERLNKFFYSDKEDKLNISAKNSSQTTNIINVDDNVTPIYDPFNQYTTELFQNFQIGYTIDRNKHIYECRQYSKLPELDEAIEKILNESIVYDEIEPVIKVNLNDIEISDKIKKKIEEAFDKIVFLLDFNRIGDELFKQWYVDGVLNLEVVYNNNSISKGIQKLILISPYSFIKVKNIESNIISYGYQNDIQTRYDNKNQKYLNMPTNVNLKGTNEPQVFKEEQIVQIESGIWNDDRTYCLSYLNKALKTANQLSLLEDSVIVYRLSRAPEKRVFYIDTGALPKTKAEQLVQNLMNKFRTKKTYNIDTGNIENNNRSISLLEDFWFPTTNKNGNTRGTRVETLQGLNYSQNDLNDLEYFKDKLYTSLNVPRTFRNKGESRINFSNQLDLEVTELQFYRFIGKLRKRFNQLFIELLKRELLSTRILDLKTWNIIQENIKFIYASNNETAELKQSQLMMMHVEEATSLMQFVEKNMISKAYILKNVFKFTDSEIEEMKKEIEEEMEELGNQEPLPDENNDDIGNTENSGMSFNSPESENELEQQPNESGEEETTPEQNTEEPNESGEEETTEK